MQKPLPSTTFTTTPNPPAPTLSCPRCRAPLVYSLTVLGGRKPPERWDYLECRQCGPFEYRWRTHALKRRTPPAA
jgi:hypothetical protein